MNAPAITPAQVVAAIAALLGLLVSLAVLDDSTSQAILAAASTLVPIAFVFADAIIRRGRAQALARGALFHAGKLYAADDPRAHELIVADVRRAARRHDQAGRATERPMHEPPAPPPAR